MPYDVILNVYDLPEQETMNNNLRSMGLGFFHTGVQFHNHEYSFSDQGVSRTRPLLPEFGTVREKILIASYRGSLESFLRIVDQLQQSSFRPGMYDVMHRNCNHFSDALLQEACGERVPDWVNRAASVGSSLPLSGKSNSNRDNKVSNTSFTAPGRAKAPSLPVGTVEENDIAGPKSNASSSSSSISSIFSWMFGSSSSSTPSATSSSVKANTSSTQKGSVSNPKKKKELTEKQKAMLENLKGKK